MLTLVSEDIERYAIEHTTALPDYLNELTDYTYENMSIPQMLSGPIEGTLLQTLVWATGAKRVLEIGTFTGFSSQMMAAALPDDGILVTCDIDPKAAEVAREFYAKSPHGHKIDLRLGPALDTLETLNDWVFDVVFIDADKTGYAAYYEKAVELLAPRGVIAVDNVSGAVASWTPRPTRTAPSPHSMSGSRTIPRTPRPPAHPRRRDADKEGS